MPRVNGHAAFNGTPAKNEPEPDQLWLFDGSKVDLAALRAKRASLAGRSYSTNTQRGYGFDWVVFERWCGAAGRMALPATADTVSLYLIDMARQGRLIATLERHWAGILSRHRSARLPIPDMLYVREVLRALRREMGSASKNAKDALTIAHLRAMLASCPETAKGARDRAVLLLGFASAMRRSELNVLEWPGDVEIVEEGVIVQLRRSKVDQDGEGRELGIHRGQHAETCPARALEAWIVERGHWCGPLFSAFHRRGTVLHRGLREGGGAIADIVKDAAKAAGLDPTRFGAHSLRAGLATTAHQNGTPDLDIMKRTGHHTVEMLGRYIRHASLFAVDPLRGVL